MNRRRFCLQKRKKKKKNYDTFLAVLASL